jgi:hypothetical protein
MLNSNLIDPNEIILKNTPWSKDSNGIAKLEDIRSFVELSMKPKNRNYIDLDNNQQSSFKRNSFIKLGGFFSNSNESYYSTQYTNEIMGGNNLTTNNYESFGINSVEITYDANKIPQVTIVFYDVRGNVLNNFESKYAAMFQLPYPIFELKIKGGFGPIITYRLVKTRDDISVDETGNYIITSRFIGDRFSPLSDLPLLYLMAVPYLDKAYEFDITNSDKKIGSFHELMQLSKRLYERLNQELDSENEKQNQIQFEKLKEELQTYEDVRKEIENKDNFLNWFKEDDNFIKLDKTIQQTWFAVIKNKTDFDFKNYIIKIKGSEQDVTSFNNFVNNIVNKKVTNLNEKFNKETNITYNNFEIKYSELVKKINDKTNEILNKGYKFHNDRYVKISNLPTQILGETKLNIKNIFQIIFNDYNILMKQIKKAGDDGYTQIIQNSRTPIGSQSFDKMGFPTVINDGKIIYPGAINDFKKWPEIIFIEKFIDAYYRSLKDNVILEIINNKEEDGSSKYIPLNPREIYQIVDGIPEPNFSIQNIYFQKDIGTFYQLIYERFLCFANINTRLDASKTDYINWNGKKNDDTWTGWASIKNFLNLSDINDINIQENLFYSIIEIEARNIAYSVSLNNDLKKQLITLSNEFNLNFIASNPTHPLTNGIKPITDNTLSVYNNIKPFDDDYVTVSNIPPDSIATGSDIITKYMKSINDLDIVYSVTKENILYIPDQKLNQNNNESDYDFLSNNDDDAFFHLINLYVDNRSRTFNFKKFYNNCLYTGLVQVPKGLLIVIANILRQKEISTNDNSVFFFKIEIKSGIYKPNFVIKKNSSFYNYLNNLWLEAYTPDKGFSVNFFNNEGNVSIVVSKDVNFNPILETETELVKKIKNYLYEKVYLSINDQQFTNETINDSIFYGKLNTSLIDDNNKLYEKYLSLLLPKVAQFIKEDDKKIQDKLKAFGSYIQDNDVKLSIYKSFQVIYENYLYGVNDEDYTLEVSDNKDTTSFLFVDRANNLIGDACILDIKTLLNDINDTEISLLSSISRLLSNNNFWFYPFQSFLTTSNDYSKLFEINFDKPANVRPIFYAMYVGGLSSNPNNNFGSSLIQNDGININNIPTDFGTSGLTGFKVKFTGLQNQMIFSNFQISTETLKNTDEGLRIQSEIVNNASNSYAIPKGQSLLNVYQKQSYVSTIKIPYGNMGIQPTQYYYQEYMPIFDGLYIIYNVTHSINAETQRLETTFKGYRMKKDVNPIITQQFVEYINTDVYIQGLQDLNLISTPSITPFNPSDDFFTNARRFVIPKEGFIDHAYWDVNNWRIGYGSEIFALNGALTAKGNDRFNDKYYRTLPSDKTQWPQNIDLETGIIKFIKIDNGHVEKYDYNKSKDFVQWDAARNNDKYKGYVTNFYTKNYADRAFDFTFKKFLDVTRAVNPNGFDKLGQKAQIALTYVSYGFGSIRSKDPNMINIRAAIASGSDADAAVALIKDLATKDGKWTNQLYYDGAKYIDSDIYNKISEDLQKELIRRKITL